MAEHQLPAVVGEASGTELFLPSSLRKALCGWGEPPLSLACCARPGECPPGCRKTASGSRCKTLPLARRAQSLWPRAGEPEEYGYQADTTGHWGPSSRRARGRAPPPSSSKPKKVRVEDDRPTKAPGCDDAVQQPRRKRRAVQTQEVIQEAPADEAAAEWRGGGTECPTTASALEADKPPEQRATGKAPGKVPEWALEALEPVTETGGGAAHWFLAERVCSVGFPYEKGGSGNIEELSCWA